MTAFENKLAALDQIYAVYDQFAATLDLACKKYCAHCCTADVTMTTLEGYKIVHKLVSEGRSASIKTLKSIKPSERFQPKITTNRLADLCISGIEPPEEERPRKTSPCPFLDDSQCPLYLVRPFGCRCLLSRHDCGNKGYAEVDDFILSVNTIFMQTIEHVDLNGCTGNMIDVITTMASEENRQTYEDNRLECNSAGLVPNQPLKALMVPPEHRDRIQPIIGKLKRIKL